MRLLLVALLTLVILPVLFGCSDNRTFRGTSPPSNPEIGDEWVNTKDGSVMVYVPAGEFVMGADASDGDASPDERPAHRVHVNAFWIGKYPVTNIQFSKFVRATGYKTDAERSGLSGSAIWRHAEAYWLNPVTEVSWNDAKAYCQWAGLRLPTEAEWEKVARGTDGRKYPWGNQWDSSKCWSEESRPQPLGAARVDRFDKVGSSSPYGVMCMAGNVWEFCQDYYSQSYYQLCATSVIRNPVGPETAEDFVYDANGTPVGRRVLRGGSWEDRKESCRTTSRWHTWSSNADSSYGFRVAYSNATLVPKTDVLTEILDLSDRVGLGNYHAFVAVTDGDRRIFEPTYSTPGGIVYRGEGILPPWLLHVVNAQEYSILGIYRKALDALDQAGQIDRSQSLIWYVRGDIYYALALLSLMRPGRDTIELGTSVWHLYPDADAKDLLAEARDAYHQADMCRHTSTRIELDCSMFVVPRISRQHQQQAESVLRGESSKIEVLSEEMEMVALRLSRLFTDDSKVGKKATKILGDE